MLVTSSCLLLYAMWMGKFPMFNVSFDADRNVPIEKIKYVVQ